MQCLCALLLLPCSLSQSSWGVNHHQFIYADLYHSDILRPFWQMMTEQECKVGSKVQQDSLLALHSLFRKSAHSSPVKASSMAQNQKINNTTNKTSASQKQQLPPVNKNQWTTKYQLKPGFPLPVQKPGLIQNATALCQKDIRGDTRWASLWSLKSQVLPLQVPAM